MRDTIRHQLTDRRTNLQLTQRQLAERLGIVQSAVWKLEHGQIEPTVQRLEEWADALAMTVHVEVVPHEAARLTAEQIELIEAARAAAPRMSSAEAATYLAILRAIAGRA